MMIRIQFQQMAVLLHANLKLDISVLETLPYACLNVQMEKLYLLRSAMTQIFSIMMAAHLIVELLKLDGCVQGNLQNAVLFVLMVP